MSFNNADEQWMLRALDLAERGAAMGEVPVGAVLVRNDEVIGEGWNQPIASHDPSAHAEICALRAAGINASNYRLPGSCLYVTLEPCAMCAGALVHARIEKLVFAAREPRAGAVCSSGRFFDAAHFNHSVQWQEGLLGDRASVMLSDFFRQRRNAR